MSQALVPIDTPLSIICKHIPRQSDIDKIVKNIKTRDIHSLELPIQAQDLIKVYQHSTHFCDIYQYITDGKLLSSVKVQNCIRAKALNYVVINNFLFRVHTTQQMTIRQKFFIHNLMNKVKRYIEACHTCLKKKPKYIKIDQYTVEYL